MPIGLITYKTFHHIIDESILPVLVMFGTTGCKPCQTLLQALRELAKEKGGNLLFRYVEGSEEPSLLQEEGITGLPTLVLYKEGLEKQRLMGLVSKEEVLVLIT